VKPNWEKIFGFLCPEIHAWRTPWFLCFGSLLALIRDKKFGDDDLDIGMFYDRYEPQFIKNLCNGRGWEIHHKIVHDETRRALYYSLVPQKDWQQVMGKIHVDLFCWYKWDGYYWHTYDVRMEEPKRGIPSMYTLKGIPCWMLDSGLVAWNGVGGTTMWVNVPLKYGSLFDNWYPPSDANPLGWIHPHKEISDAPRIIEFKNFSDLENNKFTKVKWNESASAQ